MHLLPWFSAVLWVVFLICWLWPRATAQPYKSESKRSRLIHLGLFWGSLFLAQVPLFHPLDLRWLPYFPINAYIGVAIQSSSILLAIWARQHLGDNWSSKVVVFEHQKLVQTGPYRKVRHPIYSAMLGMFLGTAIISGELLTLIALAMVTLAYWRKIRVEEQFLLDRYGEEYESYRRRTWYLIPWLF
jgi:protein-S-isoprenylcysteine O-methyltransferase Ste14